MVASGGASIASVNTRLILMVSHTVLLNIGCWMSQPTNCRIHRAYAPGIIGQPLTDMTDVGVWAVRPIGG